MSRDYGAHEQGQFLSRLLAAQDADRRKFMPEKASRVLHVLDDPLHRQMMEEDGINSDEDDFDDGGMS